MKPQLTALAVTLVSFAGCAPARSEAPALPAARTPQALQVEVSSPSAANGTRVKLSAVGLYADGITDAVTSVQWSSSNVEVARIETTNRGEVYARGSKPGIAMLTATLGELTASMPFEVTTAQLTALEMTAGFAVIPKGTQLQLGVMARFSDGSTQDVGAQATFESSNPAIGAIDANGNTLGLSPGSFMAIARFGGARAQLSLAVGSPRLDSLAVQLLEISLANGTTEQVHAIGTYTDGSLQDLTDIVTWSSSDPSIVEVESNGQGTAMLFAHAEGPATLFATLEANVARVELEVAPPELASISIDQAPTTLVTGESFQAAAYGTYTDGSRFDLTAKVAWVSSDETVARFSNDGLNTVTANGGGKCKVSATFEGKDASIAVSVSER